MWCHWPYQRQRSMLGLHGRPLRTEAMTARSPSRPHPFNRGWAMTKDWQPIETFNEPTALSYGVLVADTDGDVGEAYFRNFGDEDDGWWWVNTSWGDYPAPD